MSESELSDQLSEEEEYSEEEEDTQPETEGEGTRTGSPRGSDDLSANNENINEPIIVPKEPEVPVEKHLTKADIAEGISQLARTGINLSMLVDISSGMNIQYKKYFANIYLSINDYRRWIVSRVCTIRSKTERVYPRQRDIQL